jgi:Tfp pilus assembly protein PilN
MSTQTTTLLATLPRVNLLPPEIEQARRFRHVQAGLGGAVVASLVVAAALFVAASAQVGKAQDDLDANKAQATQLQAKVAEYAEVPLVYGQVEAAHAQLGQAMGQEVRWSYFLNDLSLKIPRHVWLDSMIVSSAAANATAPVTGQYAAVGIGTVLFEGHAYSHNDVAAWLNSLAKQKGYTQPYFSDSTVAALGSNNHAVRFTSQVTVTDDALSGRYTEKAGN